MNNDYLRKRILFYGINIVIPLLIGTTAYIVFRNDTHISVLFSKILGSAPKQINLPAWMNLIVCNYLSDFLWAYSLAFALSALHHYSRRNIIIVLAICFSFIITIELLQMTKLFSGTFDIVDILLEVVAVLLALLNIALYEEGHYEKNRKNY